MLHDDYRVLVALLEQMEKEERQRMDQNNKSPLYQDHVEVEVFFPMHRVKQLAQVRAEQTKEVGHGQR